MSHTLTIKLLLIVRGKWSTKGKKDPPGFKFYGEKGRSIGFIWAWPIPTLSSW